MGGVDGSQAQGERRLRKLISARLVDLLMTPVAESDDALLEVRQNQLYRMFNTVNPADAMQLCVRLDDTSDVLCRLFDKSLSDMTKQDLRYMLATRSALWSQAAADPE